MKRSKKNSKKPKYIAKSPREIIATTRLLLRLRLAHSTSNLLFAVEQLKKFFKLRVRVVADILLPREEARAYPKQRLITIRKGMYEGLRCGNPRSRWTLAHELGHVVLQHPKRLPRRRIGALVRPEDRLYEQEANLFAAGLLAPYDRAVRCRTAEEIASTFQISLDAAEFRLKEIRAEEHRRRAPLKLGVSPTTIGVETGHYPKLEDQAAYLCAAIAMTLDEARSKSGISIEPIRNNLLATAILTAAASGMLLSAYESVGRSTGLEKYKSAGALAAAILLVRPIRVVGSNLCSSSSNEILVFNQRCALRVAAALLDVAIKDIDQIILDRPDHSAIDTFESSYLKTLVHTGESLIANHSVLLTFDQFPSYETYNTKHDICWGDVHEIERLMNVFMLLDSHRD